MFEEGEFTFFHVILTTECNLQCSYCFGEAVEDVDADFQDFEIDYNLPKIINYDLNLLDKFCRQDPDCVLIFYGGEPLLHVNEVEQIMDGVSAKRFLIQTNGLFLDRLEAECVNRFHTILVSIDGNEAITDSYRGKGTFRKIVDNLKLIKNNGFGGELIARMTVMEQTEIDRQVRWLLNNDEFSFSSVHWQLNAGFWKNDFMEENGSVFRLYPFVGVAQSLLLGEKASLLRCGGGWINYAIQTDGQVVPCPTMWGMRDYYLGHIKDENPLKLKKIFVGEPCTSCSIFNVCGGRCLYANVTKRWDDDAYSLVCDTVRNLIEAITAELPRIRGLIESGRVSLADFEFLKFNGCEIIP